MIQTSSLLTNRSTYTRANRGFTLIELPFDRLRVVRQSERRAFTLIELLVVISIIALLIVGTGGLHLDTSAATNTNTIALPLVA